MISVYISSLIKTCVAVLYSDSDGKAADVDEVIAGRITELQFVLDYRTLDDDAADAILRLNLPSNILDTSNIRIDINVRGFESHPR